jgi:diguanylate cyclase (GGDEF)-like protein
MPLSYGSPFTVLVVDDQESIRTTLSYELKQMGVKTVWQADTAERALAVFLKERPDLVLLDIRMPGHDGYWTAQQIRESEPGSWTPIIFLSGMDRDEDLWRGIEAGGDDYLIKPVTPTVLAAKLRAMQRLLSMQRRLIAVTEELNLANQQLNDLVERDSLTGLINRRGLDRILFAQIRQARRDDKPLTLMLCDIDHFKRYNDRLGHLEGDDCLQKIAKMFDKVCKRPSDVATRYGGEEFALILPDTPKSGAMTFARACAQMLRSLQLPHPDSPTSPFVTISGGMTTCLPDENTSPEGMIMRADEALYAAKTQGRDRFFSFEYQMDSVEQRRNS